MGAKVTFIQTLQSVLKNEGPLMLYRGALAAGTGSIVTRGTLMSVFELFYTKWASDPFMREKIPFTGGIEYRTLCAGWIAGSVRSLLECPFEYAKVKRQT